jgi:uncharacterized membrane protein YhaH (DUF805 family)
MDVNTLIENFRAVVTGHYFDFEGRTRRQTFWYYMLVVFVIFLALDIVQSVLHLGYALSSLLSLALLLPNLGIGARRLHDINMTAWFLLVGLIPIIGWAVLIYWYVQPGTVGANQYGADPKGGVAAAATA